VSQKTPTYYLQGPEKYFHIHDDIGHGKIYGKKEKKIKLNKIK
jgi:hypothetical protein